MTRLLGAVFVTIFTSTMFIRSVDPVIPLIAKDMAVEPETAALLSTAFALPYALVQPLLGAIADMFGKTKLITICVLLMLVTAVVGALAPNFPVLVGSRVLCGIGAGGIFPVAMALIGDLVPLQQRQVAIGRLLAAAMLGNLFGASAAGLIGDLINWRGMFVALAVLGAGSLAVALVGMRGVVAEKSRRLDFAALGPSYQAIFRNPLAKICFAAVLIEGTCIFGLFPFTALMLHEGGETRAFIAGVVIAGFGGGGIIYALSVQHLLMWLGERKMMIGGGAVMALSFLTVALGGPWQLDFAAYVGIGFGFYMLHGVIQIYSTELSPTARGSATALHSFFFFLGNSGGPPFYGLGLAFIGWKPTVIIAGLILLGVGLVCARKLRHTPAVPNSA